MRITKANVDELIGILVDVLDDSGQQIREAADTWLEDADADNADDRREAREVLEEQIPALAEQCRDILRLIGDDE